MKYLVSLAIMLSSFAASATHLLGGEITWECTPSGGYIFQTVLYFECAGPAAIPPSTVSLTGPQGVIVCSQVSSVEISPSCVGPGSVACSWSTPGNGAIRRGTYRSSPIVLSGTPPAAGWEFSYFDCCRSGTNRNGPTGAFYLRSIMYTNFGGCTNPSPYFSESSGYIISSDSASFNTGAMSNNPSDSIYVDFSTPKDGATTTVNFSSGYSYSQPFPNSATNASNGLTTINHETGIVKTRINSGNNGSYVYAVEIQQWRKGVLLSKVYRDLAVVYKGSITQQVPPAFLVANNSHPITKTDSETHYIDACVGDTVSLDITATSSQMRLDTTLANIVASARGSAFAAPFLGSSNYSVKATLNPISPQTGYTTSLTNTVQLKWVIGGEHVLTGNSRHALYVKFSNDVCPFPAHTDLAFLIRVVPTANINGDTLRACVGDSVQFSGTTKSGNFQWTSADASFNSTQSNPSTVVTKSQYYYLSDSQSPGYQDSVFVMMDTLTPVVLNFTGGQLVLTNSNLGVHHTWYYNGVPFAYPYDTLTPFSGGVYQVSISKGNCKELSDTIGVPNGANLAIVTMGNGNYQNSPVIFTGSAGVQFTVNQNVTLQSVAIPGLVDLFGKTGGYELNLKIHDKTQAEIHHQVLTLGKPFTELVSLQMNVSLNANDEYTVSVTGDTGYAFSVYENFSLPATPFNMGFTVLNTFEGTALNMPTAASNYLLPLALGIDKGLGFGEIVNQSFVLFPNPAKDQVEIRGLTNKAEIVQLVNVEGKVLREVSIDIVKNLVLDCQNIPAGLYFVKVSFEAGTKLTQKLILK